MKLEAGYKHDFEVRALAHYAPVQEAFSVMYLSDFHFNRFSGPIIEKIVNCINSYDPDIILLGGDYADTKEGLQHVETLAKGIGHRKNAFAIAGNHDHFYGLRKVRSIFEMHHIQWLDKKAVNIEVNTSAVCIAPVNGIDTILSHKFSIICQHRPKEIKHINEGGHLIFSGHLHGSQFVLWQHGEALYPGRLFYKWNVLTRIKNNDHYIISKGLGDTLPVRYNCKKDLIFVNVVPNTIKK